MNNRHRRAGYKLCSRPELYDTIDELSDELTAALSRAERLEAECERLRVDAGRYRTLRDSGRYTAGYFGLWSLATGNMRSTAAELDAAVDAARKESET